MVVLFHMTEYAHLLKSGHCYDSVLVMPLIEVLHIS